MELQKTDRFTVEARYTIESLGIKEGKYYEVIGISLGQFCIKLGPKEKAYLNPKHFKNL